MKSGTLKRREFLGLMGAGAMVAACAPATTPGAATPGAAVTAAAPKLADKITIAMAGFQANLDRTILSSNGVWETLYNVTDPLIRFTKDGKLAPGLAESWTAVSPTKLRLKLRGDVVFADGEKFNAQAFKIVMDRILGPDSRQSDTGFPSLKKGRVEVVDDFTVDLTHEPDVALPAQLAIGVEMFSPKQVKERPESLKTAPIGSGPYRIAAYEPGRLVRLEARDDYWGEKIYGKPSIRQADLLLDRVQGVRLSLLDAGEAQLVQEISPDDATRLSADRLITLPGPELYWIRFNTLSKDDLTSDIRIRQAVSLAIDRQAMASIFAGKGDPAAQLWPRQAIGWAARPLPKPDIEKAKSLVQQAGATGKEIQAAVSRDYKARIYDVAEAVKAMVDKTGLRITFKEMDGATFRAQIRKVNDAKPELYFISMSFESFEATRGVQSRTGCGGTVSTYCNKDADALLAQAEAEPDTAKRTALLQQFMDFLDKETAAVPLVNPPLLWAKTPKLKFDPLPLQVVPLIDMKLEQ